MLTNRFRLHRILWVVPFIMVLGSGCPGEEGLSYELGECIIDGEFNRISQSECAERNGEWVGSVSPGVVSPG